ncbi:YihY/virulence factor BrkB family protein [Isosphaeraceae bacterium EP7]
MLIPVRLREAFKFGGIRPSEAVMRTWKRINDNEILTRASAVSFYGMLALVPFLALILTLIIKLLPDVTGHAQEQGVGNLTVDQMRQILREFFPTEAYTVVEAQIARIQKEPPVGLLSLGLVITLWTASSLYLAIIDAMNRIYGVVESRSIVRQRLIAVVMTFIQALILIVSLVTIVAWPQIMGWLGLSDQAVVLATTVQWVVLAIVTLTSFALTYYVAPDADQRWEWITPGSLVGAGLFLLASFGFRVYVQNFGNYDKTYGSLGGVMVLLFWFWISSLVLLASAQFNKVIEDASPLGKSYGQKHDVTNTPDLANINPSTSNAPDLANIEPRTSNTPDLANIEPRTSN